VISAELREFAEVPDRFTGIAPNSSVDRFDDGSVCVVRGPMWASVAGIDVDAAEVDALVDRVRALVPPETHCTWWLGPSVRPADLVDRLRSRGFSLPKDGPHSLIALALTHEPASPPDGIDVRRVRTFDAWLASREIAWDAFDVPDERRARIRERSDEDFAEALALGAPAHFLATLDGRPAATGTAIPSPRGMFLIAGSTAPWARRRGLSRALVHARWRYAVESGAPALVTHADPGTSYPILRRLGFEDVCTITRLEDPRAAQSAGSTSPAA